MTPTETCVSRTSGWASWTLERRDTRSWAKRWGITRQNIIYASLMQALLPPNLPMCCRVLGPLRCCRIFLTGQVLLAHCGEGPLQGLINKRAIAWYHVEVALVSVVAANRMAVLSEFSELALLCAILTSRWTAARCIPKYPRRRQSWAFRRQGFISVSFSVFSKVIVALPHRQAEVAMEESLLCVIFRLR
jgi:hypothetical protein